MLETSLTDQGLSVSSPPPRSLDLEHCLEACQSCVRLCQQSAVCCLALPAAPVEAVRILLDCADVCALAGRLRLRHHTARVCADICRACAAVCEALALAEGPTLKDCAAACRRCANLCAAL